MYVSEDFMKKGIDPPTSFDQIPSYREILEGYSDAEMLETRIEAINKLAVVPGAPVIQVAEGISQERHNRRIFAISRNVSFDFPSPKPTGDSPEGGRFAIVVETNGSDVNSTWISESEAQVILDQIEGFDPATQPLAFKYLLPVRTSSADKFDKSVREFESADQNPSDGSAEVRSNETARKTDDDTYSGTSLWLQWLAIGFPLLALLVWVIVSLNRRKVKAKDR